MLAHLSEFSSVLTLGVLALAGFRFLPFEGGVMGWKEHETLRKNQVRASPIGAYAVSV